MARPDQGKADPPPVSALRHRAPSRGLYRTTAELLWRAGGRRPQRRRARKGCRRGTVSEGADGDRGGGRFRSLRQHGLRLNGRIERTGLRESGVRRIMSATTEGNHLMSKLRHIAVIVEDPETSAK